METKQEKIEKQRILNNYGIKFNNKEMTKICQETDKQKIERLNKTIQRNQLKMGHLMAFGTDRQIDKCWKEIEQAEQELKELE